MSETRANSESASSREEADSREALETRIRAGLEAVETRLTAETSTLDFETTDLVSHLRSAGGKRMRPVLTLLAAMLGETGDSFSADVINGAVAVELTHLASLYHDDLMDDATVRRGVEAAHLKWNNTLAVMAGDLIFARSSRIISTLGPRLVAQHATTFERLCLGQMHDIFGPSEADDPIEFYIGVLREKTGALIGTAAHYGAVLARCSEDVVAAVTDFGEDLGVAFQIADDVLDLQATVGQSGKTPGADLRDGTKTLPVLLLEKRASEGTASASDAMLLLDIQDLEGTDDDELLAKTVERLALHEVTAQTVELASQWVDRAVAHLEGIPESAVKSALVDFAHLQINRLK
ncbi:polyprenyl synthetase family protein [Mobiluncus holmesii]|uniref:Polyprenyl synthetase family protein n=1 Tax=Mobiluncus porci TaxID=2652278 RepID=A0A7K0K1U3_9ACTO|nr:polyprenyl synthetase family protein [Mobiluncus porci]